MTSPVGERLSRWGAATRATLRSTWLSSLKVRTMTITGVVTAIAIVLCGTYLLLSIGGDLFNTRKDQVLADSARATASAQRLLDASDAADRVSLNSLVITMRGAIRDTSSSQLISLQRMPGQKFSFDTPQNFASEGLSGNVITGELVQEVRDGEESQYWQSVTLTNADGSTSAGIVVGSQLVFPGSAGIYGLYIAYSLADAEQTLGYVQRTMLVTGVLLMAMLGVLVWTIVRLVFRPIRVAAETSRRLALGESHVRMPEQGDESFNILSQSFNEMADSLQSRISDLAELSTMQQRFVSDVSHELRTPLTTIRLAGDVLYAQRGEFKPPTARTAELLHTQVDRFERLLNDLLEISRYDAGSVTLERDPTNLVRLAEEEVEGMSSLAEKSGSTVTLVANGGYLDADLDPRRIRRIVNNLLGNAIEHGESRPIIVTVDSNETAVALSVRDYGVGMTPEAAERSFDRFWRADPSRKRTIGGTGLGLAISLEDAAAHGGRLEVWSELGHGTCFRLTLPRIEGTEIVRSPLPLVPADEEDAAYAAVIPAPSSATAEETP
ncbi:MtrAB system histidine kinase MtrB [Klugiella xanthotipulae]|uniref:Sensor histidine kinase MtrB n=1 Tax=Klugiella xanthotipulae TaxID=244735 RepID=A0A543I4Y0_9MICO|nr:MtrAB system histidine kinase MtrB [Klugiella xanthotipulae]TQM65656.1 two-component system sensor histidine kinase MtrB [Klugiella xanthotipulae]